MKTRTFLWGWEGYPPRPDPLMTSHRAAKLLRCWRRAKTQGYRVFSLIKVGAHAYWVKHNDSGERAFFSW